MPTYPLGSSSAWDLTSWLEDSFHSLNRFNEAKSRLSWLLLHVFCTTGALERKDSHKTVLQIYQAYSNQGEGWWCPPIWLNWLNEAKSWLRFFYVPAPLQHTNDYGMLSPATLMALLLLPAWIMMKSRTIEVMLLWTPTWTFKDLTLIKLFFTPHEKRRPHTLREVLALKGSK